MRTSDSTGEEDDPNLDNVSLNIDLLEGFAKGFLGELKDTLNKDEIETLLLVQIAYLRTVGSFSDRLY